MRGKVFIDTPSNLTHQGFKLYTGNDAATMRLNSDNIAGIPRSVPYTIDGLGLEHVDADLQK